MFARFPKDMDNAKTHGFELIKLTPEWIKKTKQALSEITFNPVREEEVTHSELYTKGTYLGDYSSKSNPVLVAIAKQLKLEFDKIKPDEFQGRETVVSFFVTKGTKGYEVPWHTDNKDHKSYLALPFYFTEGSLSLEDGKLQFAQTAFLNSLREADIRSLPTREGYGAAIWSCDNKFSHRACKIESNNAIRYMIRFTLNFS